MVSLCRMTSRSTCKTSSSSSDSHQRGPKSKPAKLLSNILPEPAGRDGAPSVSTDTANLLALPFELLLNIHEHLPAKSIARLLSTCSALHAHSHSERVFAPLCTRFGVGATEISAAPAPYNSYYAVYTRLIHAFGPLIGFWASDLPFRGQILRLRLDTGANDHGLLGGSTGLALVGEVWTFPHNNAMEQLLRGGPRTPWRIGSPIPRPVFFVAFPAEVPPVESDNSHTTVKANLAHAEMHCIRTRESSHPAKIMLCADDLPRRQIAMHIQHQRDDSHMHPDFPPHGVDWIDVRRAVHDVDPLGIFGPTVDRPLALKRLSTITREVYYDEVPITSSSIPHRPSVPLLELKEGFITLNCPCTSTSNPNIALLGPSRFFPIVQSSLEPPKRNAVLWPPRTPELNLDLQDIIAQKPSGPSNLPSIIPQHLIGIWLGDYGPHGTEVLHLSLREAPLSTWPGEENASTAAQLPTLHACKVTGDFHVPRGVESWSADLGAEIARDELMEAVATVMHLNEPGAEGVRVFSGRATLSEAGFLAEQQIPCFVAIFDVDHILIYWTELKLATGFIRWREGMSNPLEDEVGNLPEYILAQVDQQ